MRNGRTTPWLALASVLALGGVAFAFGWPSDAANPDDEVGTSSTADAPKLVVVAPVKAAEGSRSRRYAGVLQARHQAALSFTIPGRMVERTVDVGDHVEAGQVVARLDRKPLRNQLRSARAAVAELDERVAQADRDDARMTTLAASASIPEAQAERTRSDLEALRASETAASSSAAEARRLLGETELRAPFSGTVSAVGLEPGEYANPGVSVVEVVGDGELELVLEVPETVVVELRGDGRRDRTLTVVFPFLNDRRVVGTLQASAEGARGPARLFPVRVTVPRAPGLLSGMTAELLIETPVRAETSVPIDAVINPGGERPSVFVVRDGVVERAPVEVIDVVDGRAYVDGPLEIDDAVVVGGHAGLAAGIEVEVRS